MWLEWELEQKNAEPSSCRALHGARQAAPAPGRTSGSIARQHSAAIMSRRHNLQIRKASTTKSPTTKSTYLPSPEINHHECSTQHHHSYHPPGSSRFAKKICLWTSTSGKITSGLILVVLDRIFDCIFLVISWHCHCFMHLERFLVHQFSRKDFLKTYSYLHSIFRGVSINRYLTGSFSFCPSLLFESFAAIAKVQCQEGLVQRSRHLSHHRRHGLRRHLHDRS